MKRLAVGGLVLLFVATSGAMARVITLDASRDSELCSNDSNKGLGGKFYCPVNVLIGWDLSGVSLDPGEYVASGKVTLFHTDGGPSTYSYDVVAYPLVKTWVEGIGIPPGGYGTGGYPWGPVSVGDATYTYQIVTAVVPDASFGALPSAGIAWAGLGATGAADSDQTRALVNSNLAGAGVGGLGSSLGSMPLTADGCDVVEDWINGGLANNGVVMVLTDVRPGIVVHMGTRETGGAPPGPGVAAPELELEILPEPASLALLGLGGLAMLRRRKR